MEEVKETPEQIAARVRSILPSFLVQTPEQIEADKKAQQLRAASFTRAHMTDEEKLISRGMVLEEIAMANIETQLELREEGHNVSTHGGANLEMLEQEQIRLATGLELQGRYSEAAKVHPHKTEQKRLQKIEEAVLMDDAEFCGCTSTNLKLDGEQLEIHPFYEVKKIYSRRHGKLVSLVGCSKCPSLNATPTPPEQLSRILHAHAATGTAAVAARRAGRPVTPTIADVQLLRKEERG